MHSSAPPSKILHAQQSIYMHSADVHVRISNPKYPGVFLLYLTLSSPGFSGSSQPGGGGGQSAPHQNFFVIGCIMMKFGKLVKCLKLYLMMGFWCVNWL